MDLCTLFAEGPKTADPFPSAALEPATPGEEQPSATPGREKWATPVEETSCRYIALSTILLINLLIAMMSRTYSLVEQQATQLWRLQDYDLLSEYKEKGPVRGQAQGFLNCQIGSSHRHLADVRSCNRDMMNQIKMPPKMTKP